MALIYNKIVESNVEPSPNDIWLKDGKLKHYKGGWKDISGKSDVKIPKFLYLPDIGITTDIISALSTPINVTAEQAQAILDAKYIKFAPRTMYNELSHYTVTTTESPIFKVTTKESWLGHGYYSYYVLFEDINASIYEVDNPKACEYIINGKLLKGFISGAAEAFDESFVFTQIGLQINSSDVVAPPTSEEMQSLKNDVTGLLSYNKQVTIPENSTNVNLPAYDIEKGGTFNEGLYKIVVPETSQVIKMQVYGENVTVEATLNSGINYVQFRKLYSLADVWGTVAHQCEIFDNNGNYKKGIAEGVGIRGGVLYNLISDSTIPTDIQVTFFGGKKASSGR